MADVRERSGSKKLVCDDPVNPCALYRRVFDYNSTLKNVNFGSICRPLFAKPFVICANSENPDMGWNAWNDNGRDYQALVGHCQAAAPKGHPSCAVDINAVGEVDISTPHGGWDGMTSMCKRFETPKAVKLDGNLKLHTIHYGELQRNPTDLKPAHAALVMAEGFYEGYGFQCECTEDEYEVMAPDFYRPDTTTAGPGVRICAPYTVCNDTEHEVKLPTATSDRVCAPSDDMFTDPAGASPSAVPSNWELKQRVTCRRQEQFTMGTAVEVTNAQITFATLDEAVQACQGSHWCTGVSVPKCDMTQVSERICPFGQISIEGTCQSCDDYCLCDQVYKPSSGPNVCQKRQNNPFDGTYNKTGIVKGGDFPNAPWCLSGECNSTRKAGCKAQCNTLKLMELREYERFWLCVNGTSDGDIAIPVTEQHGTGDYFRPESCVVSKPVGLPPTYAPSASTQPPPHYSPDNTSHAHSSQCFQYLLNDASKATWVPQNMTAKMLPAPFPGRAHRHGYLLADQGSDIDPWVAFPDYESARRACDSSPVCLGVEGPCVPPATGGTGSYRACAFVNVTVDPRQGIVLLPDRTPLYAADAARGNQYDREDDPRQLSLPMFAPNPFAPLWNDDNSRIWRAADTFRVSQDVREMTGAAATCVFKLDPGRQDAHELTGAPGNIVGQNLSAIKIWTDRMCASNVALMGDGTTWNVDPARQAVTYDSTQRLQA
jgi:hypothetical protein